MATERLPSFAEIFETYAPKFAEVEMIPGGFGNPENRNEFYLRPARLDTPLHFGYSCCEGGPPDWPLIDVAKAGLLISFNFEGSSGSNALTPYKALHQAAYEAIREQLFPGRVFGLKTVKPAPHSRLFDELSLEIIARVIPSQGGSANPACGPGLRSSSTSRALSTEHSVPSRHTSITSGRNARVSLAW